MALNRSAIRALWTRQGNEQDVALTLMIAFPMVMFYMGFQEPLPAILR
jgi:hypothetical protein